MQGTRAARARAGSAVWHARALASKTCITHGICASAMPRVRAGTRLEQEARAQQGLPLVVHVAKHGIEERRIKGALPRASAHAEPAWQRARLHTAQTPRHGCTCAEPHASAPNMACASGADRCSSRPRA